ncbi:MFS transporter [Bacillus sp. FJAT-27916]|uniref:MFS transporter n=1 Tax=Bacillus sp. FJAT-27916 TaxID=1679169 RepID=UPI0006707AE0|nr:MFS transporter [Bacillus sp. FJAT-27916]KMY45609.1 MFS transporter [Bacillus sp. FJAT-27916]
MVRKMDQSKFQVDYLQSYVSSPERQRTLYRKTLIIVVFSQIFGGAGLAAGITVGALLAQDMLGTDSFTGLPTALFTLGSALAAFLVGRLSERYGRRLGLATGFAAGGLGAAGVIIAAMMDNIWVLCVSLLIYGFGTATNLQARYAGTDLAAPKQRATAVSIAMVFTTFGAVAGPNLVEVMGDIASSIGVPALAGPFILAAAAYMMAGLVLFIFLRPDPFIVARAIERKERTISSPLSEQQLQPLSNKKGIMMGAGVMVLTQIIMVAIMTMTPVHMQHHGHDLSQVGLVIGIHVGAMYLPSLVTGVLVDKVGRTVMAIASGVTLLAAGVTATMAPAGSMAGLMIALGLLGLGWNFGLISGTALIVDSTTPEGRARTQGTVDVLIALAGASGGVLSGMVMASSSYAVLSLAGGFFALLLIPLIVWSRLKQS